MKTLNNSAVTRLPPDYDPIPFLTSPGITHATHAPTDKHRYKVDPNTNAATYEREGCKVTIEGMDKPLSIVGRNLLLLLLCELRKNVIFRSKKDCSTEVAISLLQFLNMLGKDENKKTDIDNVRRDVSIALDTLYHMSISHKDYRGNRHDYRVLQDKGISNGFIKANFTQKIANHLQLNPIISFIDKRMIRFDKRNPNAWSIYLKLIEHASMTSNQKRRTSDIISVKSLITAAIDIQNIETIRKGDRHYRRKIIEPFETAMEKLQESGLINWEYCTAGKQPIPQEEQEQLERMDIDYFETLYVKFEIVKNEQSDSSKGIGLERRNCIM